MNPWYNDACFYHFFTFGACNAPSIQSNEPVRYRLGELEKWIPHMKTLHCNAVLLSPLFQSLSHGYDTTDYYHIDARLGDNDSLKSLVAAFHNNGIHVVLDGVLNHCGRDFFAFKDLLIHGETSTYKTWFSGVDFTKRSPLGDSFDYDTWAGYYELVKFNLDNPDVVRYLIDVVRYWITTFDIDGLRLDAADCLSPQFMNTLRQATSTLKPDFWLMGEVVHGDYRHWVSSDHLHSVTNYEVFKGLFSSHNDQNLFEIAHSLDREFDNKKGIYRYFLPYNFVDNHDQNRLASLVDTPAYLYTIYLLLYTIPGIPSLYYGSEWGMKGVKDAQSDQALRPYIDIEQVAPTEPDLEKFLINLGAIREQYPVLRRGNYQQLSIEYQRPFVFRRELDGDSAIVIVNATPGVHHVSLADYMGEDMYDLLNGETIRLHDAQNIILYPHWGRILYPAANVTA